MLINWKDKDRRKQSWRIIKRNPLTIAGLLIVGFFVVLAIFAPLLVPYLGHARGRVVRLGARLQPPSREHLFGTDELGRDVLSRVIYATRLSFGLALIIVSVTAVPGISLGLIAGYRGGWVDDMIMRVADILISIPYLVLVIAILMATGGGLVMTVFAVCLPWWVEYARVVRGVVVQQKELDYVNAARATGASSLRIIFYHLLPNILNVVVIQSSLQVGRAIRVVGALGFLGLGVRPPLVEWGAMLATGRLYMPTWWWIATFPGAALFLLGLGFNLLGDGIRDIMDPRTLK